MSALDIIRRIGATSCKITTVKQPENFAINIPPLVTVSKISQVEQNGIVEGHV